MWHRGEDRATSGLQAPRAAASQACGESMAGTRARILVVDDAQGTGIALGSALVEVGHAVEVLAHGDKCLARAAQALPDLIILAAGRGGEGSGELCRQLKAQPATAACFVIFCLPDMASAAPHVPDAGADEVLSFPLATHELRTRLAGFLRHKATLDRLRDSEAQMRGLASVVADAVLIVDDAGIILEADAGAERLLGRPAADLRGAVFDAVIDAGGPAELELEAADGDRRRVLARSAVLHRVEGAARLILLHHVEPRRRFEERLREQEALLLNAQRIGRMGSWSMDLRTGRLTWSDSTCELFGVDPAEFRGSFDAFYRLVLPEDRPQLDAALDGAQASGGVIESEYLIRLPDCEVRWMYERGDLVCDAAGRPLQRLGMVMDITSRKMAEMEKQAVAQRNAALVQALGQIVYEWRPQADELTWDGSFTDALGYSREEMGSDTASWTRRVHPDDLPAVQAEVQSATRERRNFDLEYRFRHAGGSYRWMHDVGVTFVDEHGRLDRIIGVFSDVTERHRTEQERRDLLARERAARQAADEASHYYRALFESAPGCYLVLTPDDYRIVTVSEAFLQATMTTRAAISGRRLFDVFPDDPADPQADGVSNLGASLERVKATGSSSVMAVQRYPVRRPQAKGGGFEERYWSLANFPVFGPDGRLAYIINRAEDVTEYLQMKRDAGEAEDARITLQSRAQLMEADIVLRSQELRRANERLTANQVLLRMASHIARLGAWSVELPSRTLTWTDEVREILDLPPGHVPELEQALAYPVPEHRPLIRAAFEACASAGTPFDLEMQVVSATGRRIWTRSIGEAVRDASGTIVKLQGAIQDISARREAEDQLQLLKTAISRLNDVVMITEAEPIGVPGPRIVFVNDAFERMTGYRREEVIGKDPRFLQGDKTERSELDRIRAAMQAWQPVRSELTNYAKDGREIRVELDIVPIADASGWFTHWVAVERDVTERHALEERLRQSQRLEAVGQLTGGVAHDFNNLLTVIMGNAERLVELSAADAEKRKLAGMVLHAAGQGAELTQQLLSFARRQPLDPRPLDVNGLLADIEALLRRVLGAHIEIRLRCAEELPEVLIDRGRLENALLNLCINARDAMPEGGCLTLETAVRTLDADYASQHADVLPGDYVMLAVYDTGEGIRPEHLGRVFEPFFTTKPKGKGTGLGLATVFGFIKQSGGHVGVYSERGHGTTIRLYLPVATERTQVTDGGASAAGPSIVDGGTEAILLVEDDELVRRYTADQLTRLGYRVLEAENGPLAVDILRGGEPIDLLLTDVVMPGGMSGRQLADEATRLRPGLHVLYTSGYTEDAIMHQGRLDAGVRLLTKPFRRAELARAIRDALT
jgi:PAS domain S-box-containing protein